MLKISFYNYRKKYVYETDAFPNGLINKKIHEARSYAELRADIAGWTTYEKVGNSWLPYQPFNFTTTQVFARKQPVS